jgi:hypothetical protein
MSHSEYDYGKLPEFDEARYLRLVGSDARGSFGDITACIAEYRPIPPDDAADVLRRLRDIGAGDVKRCFTPGYGIGLYAAGEMRWWCAICWECNWIRICGDMHPFDGANADAVALLDMFEAMFGRRGGSV